MNLVLCIIFCCSFYLCVAVAEEYGNRTFKCLGDDFFITGLPEDRNLNWTTEKSPGSEINWAKLECKTTIYWDLKHLPPDLNLTCYRNNFNNNTRSWLDSLSWKGGRYIAINNETTINKVFYFDGTYKYISCRAFSKMENIIEEDLITIQFTYYGDIPRTVDSFKFWISTAIYRPVVNTAIGIKTELRCPSCIIPAFNYARHVLMSMMTLARCNVDWFRSSKRIAHDRRKGWIILRTISLFRDSLLNVTPKSDNYFGNYTLLLFRDSLLNVTPKSDNDFGNYTCKSGAMESVTLELVQQPVIEDLSFEDQTLVWTIKSHQPLEYIEVNLMQLGGIEWLTYNVLLPRRDNNTNEYKLVYEFTDEKLAGNIYHAMVRVKNSKGWSLPSYTIIFIRAASKGTTEGPRNPVQNTSDSEAVTVAPRHEIALYTKIVIYIKSHPGYFILGFSIAGCIVAVLIISYCICKCKQARQKQAETSHPRQQDTEPVYSEPDEQIYAYVPKEQVSHYAARALVTGNKKLGDKDFVPRVPLRPHEFPYDFAPKKLPEHRLQELGCDFATPSHHL